MKPILIIKTGQALSSIPAEKGNFEDWIISKMGISREQAIIAEVYNGFDLPPWDEVSGIVITGSSSMVTEGHDWSEKTAKWLVNGIKKDLPILGICYGHQLLAYALGGEVGKNPQGCEFGTVNIYFNDNTLDDQLFRGLPQTIKAHVCHQQSVLKLPDNAIALGFSERDNYQAFRMGDRVWGVQFHPEFDGDVLRDYINYDREPLLKDQQDPDRLIEEILDTPHSHEILKRFTKVVKEVASV
ncbi:glutamine amidotransferase class-I [Gloeothece citriformis PCC 7424]|uniref:Glutamine amidotransferase class-I n=1 Tax=Gloeothece citriformis (strain PCC 7424) TaxID=65393 RepID=B7KKM9_GLOC7|nr:glutamine amidotransferase [Gloeothece citriformis]ACK70998.1 glutamine amidotransferase class-I [Gloeothece citriformis PCC 7424]